MRFDRHVLCQTLICDIPNVDHNHPYYCCSNFVEGLYAAFLLLLLVIIVDDNVTNSGYYQYVYYPVTRTMMTCQLIMMTNLGKYLDMMVLTSK